MSDQKVIENAIVGFTKVINHPLNWAYVPTGGGWVGGCQPRGSA